MAESFLVIAKKAKRFASKEIMECLIYIKIKPLGKWSELSDHSPLVVDFDVYSDLFLQQSLS
jgi:hypothetical protein